jgi:hypothetical protein
LPSLFTESVREQTAGVGTPGEIRVAERGELLGCGEERLAPNGGVQVARELEDRGLVERRLAVEITAGGEDEESAPDGGIALVLRQRDLLPRDVCLDDQVDVLRVSRGSGTPLRSSRA